MTSYVTTYKGYEIHRHPLTGETWIEKDGYRISSAKDEGAATAIIDQLV